MDTLFFNGYFLISKENIEGKVFPKNPVNYPQSYFTELSALWVREGRIKYRGSEKEILDSFEKEGLSQPSHFHKIDLKGRYVLPGFNDAHIHIWKVGNLKTYLHDFRNISSFQALGETLKSIHQKSFESSSESNTGTEWITARGFNEAIWDIQKLPTRKEIDAFVSDKPVYLLRTCAHIAVLNTKALEIIGVDEHTMVPTGGEIRKYEDGSPSGILTETALGLINPFIAKYSQEQYKNMILKAEEELLNYGITSATDPAVHPELLEAYLDLYRENKLKIRINAIPILLPDGEIKMFPLPAIVKTPKLKIQTAKLFADGGLSSQTAALFRPYQKSNPKEKSSYGVLRIPFFLLKELVFSAMRVGYTLAIHAIGDLAIDQVLKVYSIAALEFKDAPPNRIEHFELPTQEHIKLMQKLGTIAVMQPIFIQELGINFEHSLNKDYLNMLIPLKTIHQKGINIAFSTDAPVVRSIQPFKNIYTAITRKDSRGQIFNMDESLGLYECLWSYTLGSAKADYAEAEKGSIEIGKYADMVILERNPFEVSVEDLPNITILQTYVDGECVFDSNQLNFPN